MLFGSLKCGIVLKGLTEKLILLQNKNLLAHLDSAQIYRYFSLMHYE